MFTKIISLLCLLAILITTILSTTAEANSEVNNNLNQQIRILETISPFVERIDQARLLVIKNSVHIVITDMKANVEAGRPETTFQTMRLIQNLIIQYRFSQVFFGWTEPVSMLSIYTPSIEEYLVKLKDLSKKIEKDFGLDDSPYTQITANTFKQMQKLLKDLESLPLESNFKKDLRNLWRPIGETIAIAEQGDRPRAFEKAKIVVEDLRRLYPFFDQVSTSAAGFSQVLELQGLAEFYAEFAQMDY
jgi:hypothetical protein